MPSNIFLTVLTTARELDSRLMLASRLCQDGHVVYLGLNRTLTAIARTAVPSIYLSPIFPVGSERRLSEMRALGHWILGWDEEGLVYPRGDWYRDDRVGARSIACCDLLIYWGARQKRDLLPVTGQLGIKSLLCGNPRADMLRPPYRTLIDAEAAIIRKKYGPYVLINTNFDLVNHHDGGVHFQNRLRKSGYFSGQNGQRWLQRWVGFRQRMFEEFQAGIKELLDGLPEHSVILRPHPSESPEPWLKLAEGDKRLIVELPTDSVLPWLVGADYLIHNSCTTAVEGFALGTRVIAIDPPGTDRLAASRLPNELSLKVPNFTDAAAAIRERRGEATDEQRQFLAIHIAGYPNQNSIEPIAVACTAASAKLGPASYPDVRSFEREDIGMVTPLKDFNARLPKFDDAQIAYMERILAASPHSGCRVERLHDYAVAVVHGDMIGSSG